MKTIILVISGLILSCSIHAQLKKGQWMVGGTTSFSHSHTNLNAVGPLLEDKSTTYRITPGAGYFLMDRFCSGLRIDVGNVKGTSDYNTGLYIFHSESKTSGFGLSPFVRYYFLPISRKLNVFADGSYSYSDNRAKFKSTFIYQLPGPGPSSSEELTNTHYKSHSFSIAAGPVLFINPKVSFELSVGYTHRRASEQDLTSNVVMFGTGFQVYFGK